MTSFKFTVSALSALVAVRAYETVPGRKILTSFKLAVSGISALAPDSEAARGHKA